MSGNALAENALFSIQIAATKTQTLEYYKQTTGFDSLYAEEALGLLRIKLGSYGSREEAEKNLISIKNKGFTDAFITPYTKNPEATTSINKSTAMLNEIGVTKEYKESELLAPESSPAWTRLTDEQKKHLVYVDGVLHVNEGGKFTPLSKY
jgi:hypothetical protein